VPNDLIVNIGDFVHFQWTGCDNNPAYAGEGLQGTDRSNICQLADAGHNYCIDFSSQTMFPDATTAFNMAHLNQYGGVICTTNEQTSCCKTYEQLQVVANTGNDPDQNPQNCMKINDPSAAYWNGGAVQMSTQGSYYYLSTRNNNYTNRSQKGTINVQPLLPTWGVAMASVGAVGFVAASGVAGAYYYGVSHPASAVANFFAGVSV